MQKRTGVGRGIAAKRAQRPVDSDVREAMAIRTRRALGLTQAPIVCRSNRIVFTAALAGSKAGGATQRSLESSTYAIEANHSRSWLAFVVAVNLR